LIVELESSSRSTPVSTSGRCGAISFCVQVRG
jgi:hypothetical protein